MRPRPIDCDALVIGSGAGGSAAAWELAAAGRHVTVLEEGPRVDTAQLAAATPAENMRRLYRQGGLVPILGTPMVGYGEGRCVGGTTVINGGLFWEPSAALLDRWAADSGVDGFRPADLAARLRTIAARLGVVAQGPGAGNRDSSLLAAGADRLGWSWQTAHRVVDGCVHRNRCVTGCTSGAKQSMAVSYLPEAEAMGATVRPGVRVQRLTHHDGRVTGVLAGDVRYRPRDVFLAAGPLGTPALLQTSGIHRRDAGRRLALHVNLRTTALFGEPVHADRGTIFTAQLTEFGDRGVLIMPANHSPGALAAALSAQSPALVERMLTGYDRTAVYTTQVRMSGTARVTALPYGGLLIRHAFTSRDHAALRTSFRDTARLLFAAGAVAVLPPAPVAGSLLCMSDVEDFCARVRPGDWQLVSVHGMASCRMGRPERGGVCDAQGRPYGFTNLRVTDASVLPGPTGISPQGTVMVFAHEIAARSLAAR
jgi:choline dehydrogenase-like flavoprotein